MRWVRPVAIVVVLAAAVSSNKEIAQRAHGSTAEDARALIANPRRARENYAPDFDVQIADGRQITLESLHGKVVLLDFWGTRCPPCVRAVPSLRVSGAGYHESRVLADAIEKQIGK